MTSRAARILARNNSAGGAGDTGLELMAPMFNMLAAGSRKLEQGQLSEAEFEMMLKKAEQFSAALEREVGPKESKNTETKKNDATEPRNEEGQQQYRFEKKIQAEKEARRKKGPSTRVRLKRNEGNLRGKKGNAEKSLPA